MSDLPDDVRWAKRDEVERTLKESVETLVQLSQELPTSAVDDVRLEAGKALYGALEELCSLSLSDVDREIVLFRAEVPVLQFVARIAVGEMAQRGWTAPDFDELYGGS